MYGGNLRYEFVGGGGCSYLEGFMHGGAYFVNFLVFDFTCIRSTWRACT